MSAAIPVGFGAWAIYMTNQDSTHTSVITCGFANVGGFTAAGNNADLRAVMGTGIALFDPAEFATGWTVDRTYVLQRDAVGLSSNDDFTDIVGTKVIDPPPINTSIVVRKHSTLAGRQYRGRFLMPPAWIDEADVNQGGEIASGALGTFQGLVNTFYANLVTFSLPPRLIHSVPLGGGAAPAPTTVTSFSANAMIGTIRRRIQP